MIAAVHDSQAAHARSSRLTTLALGGVITGALLLRLRWLDADAPAFLTWSGAPWTDEGVYSHVARSYALWNAPPADAWNNRLVSPLWDLLALLVFRGWGVGYVPLRLISVTLAVAALPLFWDLLRADLGPRVATLGATLWAFDHFWFQYSRLGLLEPGMTFWLVVAAWSWRRALDRGWRWAMLCGVCAGIAWIWKSLALLWLPVPLLALGVTHGVARQRRTVALGYGTGLLAILLAYALVWYLPNRAAIDAYTAVYAAQRLPESLAEAWRQLQATLRSPYIVGQTPVILAFALVGVVRAGWNLRRGLPPAMALGLAWLLCGTALLIMPYNPPRYFVLIVPPLVMLALYAITADNHYSRQIRRLTAPALLIASLGWSGWWYAQWTMSHRATLIEAGRIINQLVPPGELILGVHACGLSLAHDRPCAPLIDGLANDDQPVEALGARYALVEVGNPDDYLRRHYGALLRRSERLAQFEVGPRQVSLYRLSDDGPPTMDHGPRTTNHGPRTTNHGPRTTNHGPRTTDD